MTYFDPLLPGLLFLFVAGLCLAWRRLGRERWMLLAATTGFFLVTWTPFTHLCLLTLESGYRSDTADPPDKDFQAIVVLAAGAIGPGPWAPGGVIGPGTFVRTQHAAWLYQKVRAAPIIVSGGEVAGESGTVSYAEMMRGMLVEKGVPEDRIWLESTSHDTYENTLFSARILREHGLQKVALVTEAYHMSRAAACLRKQGIEVVPAPTGFLAPAFYEWKDFFPRTRAAGVMDTVVHEWVGLTWYTLSGRI